MNTPHMHRLGVETLPIGEENPCNSVELAKHVWKRTVDTIKAIGGNHPALAILQTSQQFYFVNVQPLFDVEGGKEAVNQALHQMARDVRALGFAMVTEAWYLDQDSAPAEEIEKLLADGIMPSDLPKLRKEALVVSAQHKDGSIVMMGDIIRDATGNVVDITEKTLPPGASFDTRWDGIITQGEA